MTSLLEKAAQSETDIIQKMIESIVNQLQDLRVWYWALATLSTKKNEDVIEHIFFIVASPNIIGNRTPVPGIRKLFRIIGKGEESQL